MKRFSGDGRNVVYDLVVVGGGIYGATMVYTATLNGFKTLLLEKADFASGASANSQKVIHGGLRYLQTLNLKRTIESIREKQRYYFLFPHLIKPMPCIMPTSGWGTNGNEAFRIAFLLYKLIQKTICRGKLARNLDKQPKILSSQEVERHFPHVNRNTIRGGALWYDGLCVEPERVIVGLLKGAAQRGAQVSNYTEVKGICRVDETTLSVSLFDHQKKQQSQVKTRKVALCTGQWFKDDLGPGPVPKELETLTLVRGMNVILHSIYKSNVSFATKVQKADESRFLFVVPWKKYSIGGTYWEECPDASATWSEKDNVKKAFHSLLKQAISNGEIFPDVLSEHVACVPGKYKEKSEQNAAEQVLPHYRLIDREKMRPGDVLQIVGVKYTTAFNVVFRALKKLFPNHSTKDVLDCAALPYGSPVADVEQVKSIYEIRYKEILSTSQIKRVFELFGDELPQIIERYIRPLQEGKELLTEIVLYSGLTAFCVEEEMTLHLDDLIYRRLFPDTPELPSSELLDELANCMAILLRWSDQEKIEELKAVEKHRKENERDVSSK